MSLHPPANSVIHVWLADSVTEFMLAGHVKGHLSGDVAVLFQYIFKVQPFCIISTSTTSTYRIIVSLTFPAWSHRYHIRHTFSKGTHHCELKQATRRKRKKNHSMQNMDKSYISWNLLSRIGSVIFLFVLVSYTNIIFHHWGSEKLNCTLLFVK